MRRVLFLAMALPVALMIALLFGLVSAAGAADRAGVSAAVRGQVELTRESKQIVGRRVESGEDIYLHDEIASGPRSGMQILLLDETVFTIGPDSSIVIDEFVYDSATGTGQVTAEVVKGVFRFVTGKVAAKRPEAMEVRLPVGNIGIRGTMVAGRVRPDRSSLVFLLGSGPNNDRGTAAGAFEASNAGVSRWVHTPGWGVELRPGEPPHVLRVDPALVASLTGELDNPTGADRFARSNVAWWQDTSPSETAGRRRARGAAYSRAGLGLLDENDATDDESYRAVETAVVQQSGIAAISQLAAIPGGTASYGGSAALTDGGRYDFGLLIDFAGRAVAANFVNIDSPSLGLVGANTSGSAPFQTGLDGLAVFEFPGTPIGQPVPQGQCAPCDVGIEALFFNAASPPGDAAHRLLIRDPASGTEVLGQASGTPQGPSRPQ